jgi:two-component system, OmpR family, alkaline phosphatase synthesis response regulator PhoP
VPDLGKIEVSTKLGINQHLSAVGVSEQLPRFTRDVTVNGKILIVDDEDDIRELLLAYLEKEGYQVSQAADGQEALKVARESSPDVVILDIMLPKMSGLEVLSTLRHESDVYVIMLTARAEEVDKLVGLNMGADDYLTKPFSPRELVARVNAAFRRLTHQPTGTEKGLYRTAHVRLDESAHKAWAEGELLDLTAIEFDLLLTLMMHNGQALTREQLLEHVWGTNYYGETRVVDVHVGHIRKKLGNRFINTVWGVGYRFEDERVA